MPAEPAPHLMRSLSPTPIRGTGIQGRRGVDPHSRPPRTRSPATPSFPMPAVSRYPLSMSNMPFITAYLEPLRKPAMQLRDSDLFPIFAKKWFAFSLVLDITFETNHPVDCHQAERGYNQAGPCTPDTILGRAAPVPSCATIPASSL